MKGLRVCPSYRLYVYRAVYLRVLWIFAYAYKSYVDIRILCAYLRDSKRVFSDVAAMP